MNKNQQRLTRIAGVIAIIGGFINMFSDLLLYNGPVSGREMTLLYMAVNIPYERTLVGAILGGAIGIPMWLGILIPMYYALKPAGKKFYVPILALFGQLIVISGAFHSAAALSSAGYYVSSQSGVSNALINEMMDKYLAFQQGFGIIAVIVMALVSLWILAAIISRKTLYKWWTFFFTPIFSILIVFLFTNHIPAPIGGYFAPIDGSLVFTLFFITTTYVTWHGKEKLMEV